MEVLRILVLVFAGFVGSFAQQDLQRTSFVFPVESDSAAVVVKAVIPHPLTSFTVCLRYYTLLTRPVTFFSYATKHTDNDIILFKEKPNEYRVYVGNAYVTFTIPDRPANIPAWEHLCASWESATGLVTLWVDGKPLPRLGLQKGYSISNDASIVLGQDQDSTLGGYEANESFVGELMDVNMWARVLTPDEVCLAFSGCNLSDYLINWRAFRYDIQGYVVLQPYLGQCPR
ncbi:C-reactive protein-like [Anolis carolinensis]|uniref:C-reactive protein-like n=1 Tax=Anolis carolinensis TaxID=28377 RepID=UPI002F2B1CE3